VPFDEDSGVEGSEGTFEESPTQDMFGNLTAVENQGGGFSDETEGRVDPESLTQPPPERAAPEGVPGAAPAEPTMVPILTLQEERRARQELAQEVKGLRELAARFDERMRIAHEQEQLRIQSEWEAEQARAAAEADPDPGPEDPLGHEIWEMNQRIAMQSAELEQLKGYAGQADQVFRGQAVDAQVNQVAKWTQTREAQYRAATPDYDDAYRFLLRSRAEEYHAIGMSPEQIALRLQRDQGEVVGLSTQYDSNGIPIGMPGNPCDTVYRLAQARGFVPGVTKTDGTGAVIGGNGNGRAVDGRSRMAAAQRAQRQMPGGRSGSVSTHPLNFETIARMSDAEMAQLQSTPQGRRMLDVAMGSR
jgi:hypothetical protein